MKKTTINLEPLSYGVREAVKTLRTNIQFCGNDKQVIMVTSSYGRRKDEDFYETGSVFGGTEEEGAAD